MAERREEEEEGEGARLGGARGLYRPRSSWGRNAMTGGGRFGPGRLDGERAELQRRCAGRGYRGGSGRGLRRVCTRGGAKGQARWR